MTAPSGLRFELRPAAAEPAGALVLMHGRGTSELDLLPLLDVLDPQRRLVGLAPGGPLSLPPGGKHWYAVRRVGFPDPATFVPTVERLGDWLDEQLAEIGLPIGRTIVGGFSQGAVMSYALGLGPGRPAPAGILVLSGFLPSVEGFDLDLAARDGFPVAIGHGARDEVISVEFGRDAARRLGDAGADVLYRESPVPHTLDPRELPTFADWVQRTLSAERL